MFQIVVGWCVAHFGLFGTKPQLVHNNLFNYTGLVLTLLSGVLFVFVYKNFSETKIVAVESSTEYGSTSIPGHSQTRLLLIRRIFFIGFAVFLGCFHGLMLTPIVYIQDRDPLASDNVLDYVFAHFSTVFFCATIYFGIYSLIKGSKAYVKAELVLPAICYGALWSTGMCLWFVANRMLSQTVSFPIAVRVSFCCCLCNF